MITSIMLFEKKIKLKKIDIIIPNSFTNFFPTDSQFFQTFSNKDFSKIKQIKTFNKILS